MKKIIKYCLLMVMVFTLLFPINIYASGTNNDDTLIKGTINDYFMTEIQAIQHNIYDKNIISNDKLKAYENKYCAFLNNWYKKAGINLISYKLYTDFAPISYSDNTAIVNITMGMDQTFDVAPDINSQVRNLKYKFELIKTKENTWKIDKYYDLNEEGFDIEKNSTQLDDYTKNMDTLISNLKPQKSNNSAQLKSSNLVSPMFNTSTFRNNAVWYAHNYSFSYNSNYRNFTDHDCTNFLSQCWNYGGISQTSNWYYNNYYSYSSSWTVVNDFKNYMVNNGWCYISTDNVSSSQRGDGIQFYSSSSGSYDHSAIITKIDSQGYRYYSAHDTDHNDWPLISVYPTNSYPHVRFLCVYNF